MTTNRILYTPYFLEQPRPQMAALAGTDWTVNRLEANEGRTALEQMGALGRGVADFVAATLQAGQRPVSFHGDCCITLGVMAGLQRAGVDPLLIWLDSHGDFNTWETTPSGFIGGMPLAMLVGRGDLQLMHMVGAQIHPETQVILSDGRDLDPAEAEMLRQSQVRLVPDMTELLHMDLGSRPIYVHFDSDVLHLDDAPAMLYPAAGGARLDAVRGVLRHVAASGRLAAVSMTTWNVADTSAVETQAACMACFHDLIGS